MMVLMGCVQAFSIEYYIANINNRLPVEDAALTIYNNYSEVINTSTTNADGLSAFDINESRTYYTVKVEKIGYHTQYINYTWTGIDSESLYLYPISDDGIVRIRFNDLTYIDRDFCVFYNSNGRLEGCYSMNETVTLLVNQQYKITPKLGSLDILSSEASIEKNIMVLSGLGVALVALIGFVGLGVAFFKRMTR